MTPVPVPFTKAEMHADLRSVLTRLVSFTLWAAGEEKALQLIGSSRRVEDMTWTLFDSHASPDDLGLEIQHWPITDTFDVLYDFAVHAVARYPMSEFANETSASNSAALVYDLANSLLADEFSHPRDQGQKCVHIAQLAAARCVLEGYERMIIFSTRDAEDESSEDLTIRDVALLAGMEEASVRNAANPKLPNPLITKKVSGSTLVEPKHAKAWLEARDRYTPLQHKAHGRDIDLAKAGFKSAHEIWSVLQGRAEARGINLEKVLAGLGLEFPDSTMPEQVAKKLAAQLGYDEELFALRLSELRTNDEATRIRQAIEIAASRVSAK
jgi:hypothetical protein